MNPTKEQQQWFWEQCGFKFDKAFPITPQGSIWWTSPIDIDLNNLFKYAPEYQQIIFQPGYCGITIDDKLYEGSGDTEESALFEAIYKALRGKDGTD